MAEGAEGGDSGWLVDMVIGFMRSPTWNTPLTQFINDKCILFDNFQEENKHEYVEVHNEFKALVDDLLAAHLVEVDILPEDFEKQVVESGLTEDPRMAQVMSQLRAAEDFLVFKQMMIDHHAGMQAQAEANLKDTAAWEASQREDEAVAAAMAASMAESGGAAASAPAPASTVPAPTAEQERAFGAGGGTYGRASMPVGGKKPASNEKAAAIRKAICSAARPT
mmetsp:Transcript_41719/g.108049  ORF Transcript_41719/g.108049 Transcript_41719/m.108049 type:complete len:223 (+) Transcript_41719:63-731(+)